MKEFLAEHPELVQTILAWTAAAIGFGWSQYALRKTNSWTWTAGRVAITAQLFVSGLASYVVADMSFFHVANLHLGSSTEFGLKLIAVCMWASMIGIFTKARKLQGN